MWISIKACLCVNKKLNIVSFVPVWEMESDNNNEEGCCLRYLGKQYYCSDLHDMLYNIHTKEFKPNVIINYYEKNNQSLDVGKEVYIEKNATFRTLVKVKIVKSITRISSSYMLCYTHDGDRYLFDDSGITPIKNETYHIVVHETLYQVENRGDNLYKHYQFYTIEKE